MSSMKDWLDSLKKAAEDKLKKAEDPDAQKEAKKENARKQATRAIKAIGLAKKGVDQYNEVSKKVDGITTDAANKIIDLAEKAKPLAEKVDDAASSLLKKAKGLFQKAAEKTRQDNIAKPSTGSGIIDLPAPAVPETDATKPKTAKDAPPQP